MTKEQLLAMFPGLTISQILKEKGYRKAPYSSPANYTMITGKDIIKKKSGTTQNSSIKKKKKKKK